MNPSYVTSFLAIRCATKEKKKLSTMAKRVFVCVVRRVTYLEIM
jgi:hypothetical protein